MVDYVVYSKFRERAHMGKIGITGRSRSFTRFGSDWSGVYTTLTGVVGWAHVFE